MKNRESVHIAVIRLSSLGDVAMTVPVLQLLLEQHPEINITVVSRPAFEALFAHMPRCRFFSAELNGKHKGIFGVLRLAAEIAALKPDYIADLHEVLRTNIMDLLFRYLYKIPVSKIDKGRKEKQELCKNVPKIKILPLKSTFLRYRDVFGKLGFSINMLADYKFPEFSLSEKSKAMLDNAGKGIPIGIAPFARYAGKTYPAYLMQELIEILLQQNKSLHIFLFGGKEDLKELELRKAEHPDRITVVAAQLSLSEELELMSKLRLMLTMDSGNMHMAAMLGIPVISLWGATHPYLGFYGWRQDPENAILADRNKFPNLPSSVNGSKIHPGSEMCMNTIRPEQVADKILEKLNLK